MNPCARRSPGRNDTRWTVRWVIALLMILGLVWLPPPPPPPPPPHPRPPRRRPPLRRPPLRRPPLRRPPLRRPPPPQHRRSPSRPLRRPPRKAHCQLPGVTGGDTRHQLADRTHPGWPLDRADHRPGPHRARQPLGRRPLVPSRRRRDGAGSPRHHHVRTRDTPRHDPRTTTSEHHQPEHRQPEHPEPDPHQPDPHQPDPHTGRCPALRNRRRPGAARGARPDGHRTRVRPREPSSSHPRTRRRRPGDPDGRTRRNHHHQLLDGRPDSRRLHPAMDHPVTTPHGRRPDSDICRSIAVAAIAVADLEDSGARSHGSRRGGPLAGEP